MGGSAPDMAGWKRLATRDSTKMKIQSDDIEEGKKMKGGVSDVKNGKTSAPAFLEKGKQMEGRTSSNKNKIAHVREKEDATTTWNGHNKVKSRRMPTGFLEKAKKKETICIASNKEKMQTGDKDEAKNKCNSDHKLKNMKESTTLSEKEKNKEKLNKTHKEKMWAADSNERKIPNGHNRVKSGEVPTSCFGKERKGRRLNKTNNEELQSDGDEEEAMWNYDNKVKNGKVTAAFSEEENKKKRAKNTNTEKETVPMAPAVKEKKMRPSEENKKKRAKNTNTEKETVPMTPAVKEKKMRPSESKEIMMRHDKRNWRNVPSNVSKEKKMDTPSGSNYKKRKREEPHTLFKKEKRTRCNDSDMNIHNGMVQEKKICGSGKENNRQAPFAFLKFICNNFKEYLLIPPAVAPKLVDLTNHHVSLKDSEERLSKVRISMVDGSLAFHQGWNIFVSDYSIRRGEFLLFEFIARGTFSVRVFSMDSNERLLLKNDPKGVEHGVVSGPTAQDNENLIKRQCKTKGTTPLHRKQKIVILISDSGASAHNEDTVNLIASDADSTHHVTINTNKDPNRVQSGVGNFPDGECRTKCISPTCSEEKTSSETIVVAPVTHANDDRVGNELEVNDLDEDLTRKQGLNSIPIDSIKAVEEQQNHSKMNISQNVCRKYAAPGGFRCLEKWKKGIVNSGAAFDDNVLIEPENTQKTDSKLVHGCGSTGLNATNEYFCSEGNHTHVPPVLTMPVKELSSADSVTKCRYGGTEHHCIDEKGGGDAVQIETQGEQLEPVGSLVNSQSNNILVSANPVGPEGVCAFVELMLTAPAEKPSSPDGILKCGSSRTEVDNNVNGKGTIVQHETKMCQVEPVVCSQSSDIALYPNQVVVAHVSEHCFSEQEGRNTINCAIPESLLPMKDKILDLDDRYLKLSLQLCIPDTAQKWLELPKSLSNAVKQKKQDRNIIMLKDPMKRLWPVLYYENPVFVGFTAGWKHFVAANNLQTGDLCDLIKESDDDESVYSVLITKR